MLYTQYNAGICLGMLRENESICMTSDQTGCIAEKKILPILFTGMEENVGNSRIRTDLALEATESFSQGSTELRGVEVKEQYDEERDIRTTVVKITTENGAKAMGRPLRELI